MTDKNSCFRYGANLSNQNEDGYTPLHKACHEGRTETAHILIDHGVNIEITSGNGATPFHAACFQGHMETARMLIDTSSLYVYLRS